MSNKNIFCSAFFILAFSLVKPVAFEASESNVNHNSYIETLNSFYSEYISTSFDEHEIVGYRWSNSPDISVKTRDVGNSDNIIQPLNRADNRYLHVDLIKNNKKYREIIDVKTGESTGNVLTYIYPDVDKEPKPSQSKDKLSKDNSEVNRNKNTTVSKRDKTKSLHTDELEDTSKKSIAKHKDKNPEIDGISIDKSKDNGEDTIVLVHNPNFKSYGHGHIEIYYENKIIETRFNVESSDNRSEAFLISENGRYEVRVVSEPGVFYSESFEVKDIDKGLAFNPMPSLKIDKNEINLKDAKRDIDPILISDWTEGDSWEVRVSSSDEFHGDLKLHSERHTIKHRKSTGGIPISDSPEVFVNSNSKSVDSNERQKEISNTSFIINNISSDDIEIIWNLVISE